MGMVPNRNEIAISIFGVTAKDFTHERLRKSACSSILTLSNLLLDFAGNLADFGKPEAGNRFVIIRYDSEAAYDKFWNGGGKAWIEKYAPQARSVRVEGVEPK
jgi:hypothetical protein